MTVYMHGDYARSYEQCITYTAIIVYIHCRGMLSEDNTARRYRCC